MKRKLLGQNWQHYQKIIEASPSGIILVNKEGGIVLVNKMVEKLFGYNRDELLNNSIEILIPERLRKDHLNLRDQFFVTSETRPMGTGRELFGLKKDRSEFLLEIGLNPLEINEEQFFLVFLIDITERNRVQERFQQVVESAPNGMILVDETGKIRMVNKTTEALFGYIREELLTMSVESLVPERYRGKHTVLRAEFHKDPKIRKLGVGRDLYGRKKDGREVPIEIGLNPIETDEGKFVLVSIVDITERKQAEDIIKRDRDAITILFQEQGNNLLKANIDLERGKRLSDIGLLAAFVAHEIRNPLASISFAVANIKIKVNDPDVDKNIATIDKKIAESDQIINNLLFYSRIKPPHFEKVNIFDILEECVSEDLKKESGKETVMIKELDSIKGILIEADPIQIKEVFNNLLNNAHDALPSEKGQIKVIAENEDEFIKVAIEDNGFGINKDILDKIFDAFFTTKRKGTGLGLPVCQQIINMHGGTVEIKSEQGQGASFIVRLPKKKKNN
jgi:PAS domain S-box-containing protein